MPRFPGATQKRVTGIDKTTSAATRFVELDRHISAAQKIAEVAGEPLLAFLLAMAGEEVAIASRRRSARQPASGVPRQTNGSS